MTLLAVNLLDPRSLLTAAGSLAVLLVLFCETGLLIGFFLPGDSLLFTAGVLCATGSRTVHLSLPVTLLCAVLGALGGAQLGYLIGQRAGRPLLARRSNPRLLQAADRAQHFLQRYGVGRALVLSRFVPLVRTVINPLAGMTGVGRRSGNVAAGVRSGTPSTSAFRGRSAARAPRSRTRTRPLPVIVPIRSAWSSKWSNTSRAAVSASGRTTISIRS